MKTVIKDPVTLEVVEEYFDSEPRCPAACGTQPLCEACGGCAGCLILQAEYYGWVVEREEEA